MIPSEFGCRSSTWLGKVFGDIKLDLYLKLEVEKIGSADCLLGASDEYSLITSTTFGGQCWFEAPLGACFEQHFDLEYLEDHQPLRGRGIIP